MKNKFLLIGVEKLKNINHLLYFLDMERNIIIHSFNIVDYDVIQGKEPISLSQKLKEDYRGILSLSFNVDGALLYDNKSYNIRHVTNNIKNIVKMILKIAQFYERDIRGNFNYTNHSNNLTENSNSGIVYIFKNHTAVLEEYNMDDIEVTYETFSHVKTRTVFNKHIPKKKKTTFEALLTRHDEELWDFFHKKKTKKRKLEITDGAQSMEELIKNTKALKISDKEPLKTLKDYTVIQLKEIAKEKQVKGYSKMKKEELFKVLKFSYQL